MKTNTTKRVMHTILFVAAALFFGATGCRHAHLGADHGIATRASFMHQRQLRSERSPADQDANDAHAVIGKHRKNGKLETTSISDDSMGFGSSFSSGAAALPIVPLGSTPTAPIHLKAK